MVAIALDNWLGLGMTTFALIGIVALVIGSDWLKLGLKIGAKGEKALKIVGVAMVGCVVLSYMGVSIAAPEEQAAVGENEDWEVTVVENMAFTTYDSSSKHFNVHMSYNDTSSAFVSSTGSFVVNFTMTNNAPTETFNARGDIESVGLIDVAGGDDLYIIDKNADETFKVLWAKTGGFSTYEENTVRVEAGDSAWTLLTITLDAPAVAAMDTNESSDFSFSLCGIIYTVTVWKGTVST